MLTRVVQTEAEDTVTCSGSRQVVPVRKGAQLCHGFIM